MLPAVCDLLHRLGSARALDTPLTGSRAGVASFRFRVNRGWAAAASGFISLLKGRCAVLAALGARRRLIGLHAAPSAERTQRARWCSCTPRLEDRGPGPLRVICGDP